MNQDMPPPTSHLERFTRLMGNEETSLPHHNNDSTRYSAPNSRQMMVPPHLQRQHKAAPVPKVADESISKHNSSEPTHGISPEVHSDLALLSLDTAGRPNEPTLKAKCTATDSIKLRFVPIFALAKFPYKFLPPAARKSEQAIASTFFDKGQFWQRSWDLYYVWFKDTPFQTPMVFVSEAQAAALVKDIVRRFPNVGIGFPNSSRHPGFLCDFKSCPAFSPRLVGRSSSRDHSNDLISGAAELDVPPKRQPQELENYIGIVHDATDATKKQHKEAKLKERTQKQAGMSSQLKRAQRYIGLRSKGLDDAFKPTADEKGGLPDSYSASSMQQPDDEDVILIAVDVEADERNHRNITEIGVATLDTRDLKGKAPGERCSDWFGLIRARHFRTKEFMHVQNYQFIKGCPNNFEFGRSEIISRYEADSIIASCFKQPFSGSDLHSSEKRNIVFLGHDPSADIKYLQQMGYNPFNLSNLVEVMDTGLLYRASTGEPNSRALGHVLQTLDIDGWYLHNAGNDAVYTMQAMLAMCVNETAKATEQKAAEPIKKSVSVAAKKQTLSYADREYYGEG